MNVYNLKQLFSPKTIAVIGASQDENKIGSKIFLNAKKTKSIKVIPINQKREYVFKSKAFSSVNNYLDKIDVAVIAIPADSVIKVLEEINNKKIPFTVIVSSGFKEIGENGKTREKELNEFIKKSNTRIIGPNCLGILTDNLNLTFGASINNAGKCAVLSQSGAIGSSLIDYLNNENIGIHSFISLGNKSDLSENDFLDYYLSDKKVNAIFLYLESFKDGAKFYSICKKITPKKPIIILKPGKNTNAKRAMTSHTGALISDIIAAKTAFSQANIIEAETLDEFFNLLRYYSIASERTKTQWKNIPAIITNAGGIGVLLADTLNNTNPKDIGGGATSTDYKKAIRNLNNNVSSLFCVITPQEVTDLEQIANLIVEMQRKVKYPIFTIIPGGKKVEKAHKILKNNNCLCFDFPEEATQIYEKIKNYEVQKRKQTDFNINIKNIFRFYKTFALKNKKNNFLTQSEIQHLALEYKLPINPEYQINSFEECKKVAKKIKFPVIAKLYGQKFIHKTEFNAVKQNIVSEKQLKEAYLSLKVIAGNEKDTIITISKHLTKSLEVIIGVKNDPDFGHLLMFGMGGIYAEIMKDLSYGLLPMTQKQIYDMMKKTKTWKILEGARGLPKLDIKGIVNCIKNLSILIEENRWISELDINPLFVGENWVKIVDLKIK